MKNTTEAMTEKEAISLTIRHWENIVKILRSSDPLSGCSRYQDKLSYIKRTALDMMKVPKSKYPSGGCFLCQYAHERTKTLPPNSVSDVCKKFCPAYGKWPPNDFATCYLDPSVYVDFVVSIHRNNHEEAATYATELVEFFKSLYRKGERP